MHLTRKNSGCDVNLIATGISAQFPSAKVSALESSINHEIWLRRAIIVGDGADALTVADGGAVGRTRQTDLEGLVPLDLGIAIDRDRDRLRVLVGLEMQHVRGCDKVAVGRGGGSVGGGVVHVGCRCAA